MMPDGHGPLFPLRQPPANIQAEQSFLGALLRNNKALDRALFLRPEHFADPINGKIFERSLARIEAGRIADAVTLKEDFENTGSLEEVGGTGYLVQLLSAMVGIINAGDYARVIYDAYLRREVISIGEDVVNDAFGVRAGTDAEQVITDAVQKLLAVGSASTKSQATTFGEAVGTAVARAGAAAKGEGNSGALTCGIPSVDEIWGGLWPGEQYYIVARSRTGKTPFMMQVVRHVARQLLEQGEGEHVQVFSLEMPADGIATGSISALTGISADDIRRGRINDAQGEALIQAQRKLHPLPILIDDSANLTLADIAMRARSTKRTKKTRLIAIDHRDLIGRNRDLLRTSNMEWLPYLTRQTKQLAKELGVTLLLLVQLNKDVETREDSRPRLSDLPYSGEQDADAILALHRPELYMPEEPPDPPSGFSEEKKANARSQWLEKRKSIVGIAEVSFLKRRFGKTGWHRLGFDGPRMLFSDLPDSGPTQMHFDQNDYPMSEADYGR